VTRYGPNQLRLLEYDIVMRIWESTEAFLQSRDDPRPFLFMEENIDERVWHRVCESLEWYLLDL